MTEKQPKMASGKVTGEVIDVTDETVGAKGHRKVTIAIAFEDGKFPREIAVEFFGKNAEKTEGVRVGDAVTAFYDSKSRKSGTRWFSSHDGWKVDMIRAARRGPESHGQRRGYGTGGGPDGPPPPDLDDDLPFAAASIASDPSSIAPVIRRPL